MCSSGLEDDQKLVRFVELMIHDYLNARGFKDTEAKFAEERTAATASAADSACGKGAAADGGLDDATSWYCLAEKLALPVSKGWYQYVMTTIFRINRYTTTSVGLGVG